MRYDQLANAMGVSVENTELLKLIAEAPAPETEPKLEGISYFCFPKSGIEFSTRGANRCVNQILLFGPDYSKNYSCFIGELPEHVVFGEPLHMIELKLGKPDAQKYVDKPDVDAHLFLRLRYLRAGHLLDLVLDEQQKLFFVQLLADPRPPRY